MLHRYGILSDTHGKVHRDIFLHFEGVELIFHGGDVGGEDVLVELEAIAPVRAIAGNVDPPLHPALPETRLEEMPFGRVAMAHGHLHGGALPARLKNLQEAFAADQPRLLIHGHSHLPLLDLRGRMWLLNPGSAGRPRLGAPSCLAVMTWDSDHDLLHFEFKMLHWET